MPEPEVIDLTGLSESESEEEEEELEDQLSEQSSSDDDGEVPLDATSRARLHEAIENLSEGRLRRVLNDLVDSIPVVEETLIGQLLTLKRKTHDIVSRYETCCNCDEEFDMTSHRKEGECSFHPGEIELDEEKFVDWDESSHGPIDSSRNQSEYPENFKWTCSPKPKFQKTSISLESIAPAHHNRTPSPSHASSHHMSSDDDSDDAPTPSYPTVCRLRASIASASETRLREIMVRLVDRSPGFQYAVAKELLASNQSATEYSVLSPRRKRRRSAGRRGFDAQSSDRPCPKCGQHFNDDAISPCQYHPGKLP
ncbi:hypothetical protein C0991_007261 [Blastosporella zonata]|nr:hypothetical protein C0991_007261 [Blastosporella zonata]